MQYLSKINWSGKFIFIILALSLLLGFYLQEDVSTGGATVDFYLFIWKFALALQENFFYTYNNWEEAHLPLHSIILAAINFFANDEYLVRFIYCLISIIAPFIFYLSLKEKFSNINENLLIIFASILFILPSFRYTSIWANVQTTAIIFFLFSNLFFLKWIKQDSRTIDKYLVLQILFMTFAVYTRADYVLYYFYFMLIYFQKLKFSDFLKLSFFVLLLSLHGFSFVYEHSVTFSNIKFTNQFQNSLLVNSSIISLYLIPIFFCVVINDVNILRKEMKFIIISSIIFSFLVYIFSNYFNYNYSLGGGFILKLSLILLGNNFLFYISSIFGLVMLSYLAKNNLNNLILILLILFGYSGATVFQKYFEPIFIIIFFLLIHSKISSDFFKNNKNILYLYIYIVIYFGSSIINSFFEFSKNI
tara:strand:+ start:1918 stop:3171 length:1254 start_codon:yes stop_codon:yes gene_type:complete